MLMVQCGSFAELRSKTAMALKTISVVKIEMYSEKREVNE